MKEPKAKSLLKKGKIKEFDEYVRKILRKFCTTVIKWAGVKYEVRGLENIPTDRAVVFVSNHQSNLDPLLLVAALDKPYAALAKIELSKLPVVPTWMGFLRCVFVDRDNIRASVLSMKKSVEVVKSGYSMTVFPEGTRSGSAELAEFKAGAYKIAEKAKSDIVPVCINGAYSIMKRGSMKIHGGNVLVEILPPIRLSEMAKAQIKQLPETTKQMIKERIEIYENEKSSRN
jgi:1-acyl-sn-glycerol-3-phosphate acyltransferase